VTQQWRLLRWYYFATPVFWLLDVVWHVRVRVAFLDDFPAGRNLYYALCCAIGIVAAAAPRYTRQLAFLESATNLGLLVLSVGVWYVRMLDWAAGPGVAVPVLSPWQLVNFVIAAIIAAVSYGLRSAAVAPHDERP
jgi:hypothetical protein